MTRKPIGRRALRVALAALLMVGLASLTAPAEAATKRSLSFTSSSATATLGDTVTFSGVLSKSPTGSTVSVQQLVKGKWRGVKTVKTNTATGTFSTTLKPPIGTSSYRARAVKTRKLKEATSATRKVAAYRATTATLTVDDSEPTVGDTVTLSGSATPFLKGTAATLQRKIDTAWQPVATTKLSSKGAYSFAQKPLAGLWTYRVVVSRTSSYLAAATSQEVAVDTAGPASLQVQVINLPEGSPRPDVTVIDPAKASRIVRQTTTIGNAEPGTWKVSGEPVAATGGELWPVAKDLEVVVGRGQSAVVVMDYSALIPDDTDVVEPDDVEQVEQDGQTSAVTLAAQQPLPEVGDTFVTGVGDKTPYGLLGTVTQVDGRVAQVDTSDTTLLDALSSGSMDVSVPLGAGDVVDPGEGDDVTPIEVQAKRGLVSHPSRAMQRAAATSKDSVDRRVKKNFTCEVQRTATLESEIGFHPSVDLRAEWNLFDGVTSAAFTSGITQSASAKLTLDGRTKDKPCELKRTAILSKPIQMGTVTFAVGPVPVVIVPQIQFYIDGTGSFQATVTASAKQTFSARAGIKYTKSSGFSPIQSVSNKVTYEPPTFAGRAEAQVGVAPQLTGLFYGVAGPRVYVRAGLEADAQAAATPDAFNLDWNVDLRVKAAAALDAEVLNLHSGEVELYNRLFDVANGRVGYTPPPATTITTESLPDATVGEPYSAHLTTADNRPGEWSISSGSLPSGLKLKGDTISGTAVSEGSSNFTVRFFDGDTAASRSLGLAARPSSASPTPDPRNHVTIRISTAANGTQANNNSYTPTISADGSDITYHSEASNLVPEDDNYYVDVFSTNSSSGATARVNEPVDETRTNNDAYAPSISANGRYIAYQSHASNLVKNDINHATDVFVTDTVTGRTIPISAATDGTQGNNSSYGPAISGDGRYVTYQSNASNLVAGDTNEALDIFVTDVSSGATTRISEATDGSQPNNSSSEPSISADGRFITYQSSASNLVSDDTNGLTDVFVTDTSSGTTTRVSTSTDGEQADKHSYAAAISGDGRYVAYQSNASNLVAGDTNEALDIFVTDTSSGATTRVSTSTDGTQTNDASLYPSISADGSYVAYQSSASNLVSDDTNGLTDIFVTDTSSGTTTRVSTSTDGTQANDSSLYPSISADGSCVAYQSDASNLVEHDTNEVADIFIRSRP